MSASGRAAPRGLARPWLGVLLSAMLLSWGDSRIALGGEAASSGARLSVELKKTVELKGFTLLFRAVTEDSRCPTGAQCAWAGIARVELAVSGPGIEPTVVALSSDPGESSARAGDLVLRFVSLEPYPSAKEPSKDTYRLELKAELRSATPSPAPTR